MMTHLPIHPILAGNAHVYLIPNGPHSLLVDTGIPGMEKRILNAARRFGVSPSDISVIVLTHAHFDHAGSLYALQCLTPAQIITGKGENPGLAKGSTPMPAGTNSFGKAASWLGSRLHRLSRFHPVTPDLLVDSRYDLEACELPAYLLPTPGHTAGSISLILEDRAAICGDALFGIFPGTAYPPFADEPDLLLQSWETLLKTSCQVFYPAHGKPVSRQVLEKSLREKQR